MMIPEIKYQAIALHNNVNHMYDGESYSVHLYMVETWALRFIDLIPEMDRDCVLAAIWWHDTIEDTRQTYNDVKKAIGYHAAEIVFALTNNKGRTRADRANDEYYAGIRGTEYATFVKVCDRLANIEYSKITKSTMYNVYKKEHENFCKELNIPQPMYNRLQQLLNIH